MCGLLILELTRVMCLGLIEVNLFAASQQKLGLAHHRQQDQVQADLELQADVELERRPDVLGNQATSRCKTG